MNVRLTGWSRDSVEDFAAMFIFNYVRLYLSPKFVAVANGRFRHEPTFPTLHWKVYFSSRDPADLWDEAVIRSR